MNQDQESELEAFCKRLERSPNFGSSWVVGLLIVGFIILLGVVR